MAYADLLHGNAIETYSAGGLRLRGREGRLDAGLELHDLRGAVELRLSAGVGPFCRLRRNTTSRRSVTGEDGRAVLEVLFAAYASAGTGRKIALPFRYRRRQADRLVAAVSCQPRRRQPRHQLPLSLPMRTEPDRRAIGIDIGGTKIAVAAVDGQGTNPRDARRSQPKPNWV